MHTTTMLHEASSTILFPDYSVVLLSDRWNNKASTPTMPVLCYVLHVVLYNRVITNLRRKTNDSIWKLNGYILDIRIVLLFDEQIYFV